MTPPWLTKTCTCCLRTFQTREEWDQLTLVGEQTYVFDECAEHHLLRNCTCGTTLAVVTYNSAPGAPEI